MEKLRDEFIIWLFLAVTERESNSKKGETKACREERGTGKVHEIMKEIRRVLGRLSFQMERDRWNFYLVVCRDEVNQKYTHTHTDT
jgi:hypothetical protein